MPRLIVFNSVSLDGYFVDGKGDMSWAHTGGAEWSAFVQKNASGDARFLFGRVTYQMMEAFWPTPFAIESLPVVAKRMNSGRKTVFSRTLSKVTWKNTRLVKGDLIAEVRRLKKRPGPDLVVLGSGSLVSQLAQEGLIDEVQLAVIPIILGKGRSLFDGVKRRVDLKLLSTRTFQNGNVFVRYKPKS